MLRKTFLILAGLTGLSGCIGPEAPGCPYAAEIARAPSAGCYLSSSDGVLVVLGRAKKISPPGGSANSNESAQCTAFRETWEETGLTVNVGERLAVFDTGFYLYRCSVAANSGPIAPPRPLEVERAFYMPTREFDKWQWRFPGQERVLEQIALNAVSRDPTAKVAPSPVSPPR